MKKAFAAGFWAWTALTAWSAVNPGEYAVVRRLQLTEPVAAGSAAVWEPDAEFFSVVDDLYGDWRAVTPAGREQRWRVIRLEAPAYEAAYEPCPARLSATGTRPAASDGSGGAAQIFEVTLARTTDELSALELQIANRTFEKWLTVEVADAAGRWTPLLERHRLTGTAERDPGRTERIYLQQRGSGERLRLTVEEVSGEPQPLPPEELRLDAVVPLRRNPSPTAGVPLLTAYSLESRPVERKNGAILYSFAARGLPLSGFTLTGARADFQGKYRLLVSADGRDWRPAAAGNLRAAADGIDDLTKEFETVRAAYVALELAVQPEVPDGVAIVWRGPRYVVWFEDAAPALHLYCGGDTERPDYPVLRMPECAELAELPRYLAAQPEINMKYQPLLEREQQYLSGVYAVLGGGALVVGVVLYLSMRRLKKQMAE